MPLVSVWESHMVKVIEGSQLSHFMCVEDSDLYSWNLFLEKYPKELWMKSYP